MINHHRPSSIISMALPTVRHIAAKSGAADACSRSGGVQQMVAAIGRRRFFAALQRIYAPAPARTCAISLRAACRQRCR
ncbi:hypothetical protein FHY12_002832 [Xanthomonas arboricola]|uniref:hypothetical protein n=1 Tax=Xanthomonas euroxanthea TaxID=2259622 RepID=UPI00141BF156|nr:hypothetical protein [Xanthomonas euroxanthea]NIK40507.1 hypothetical protein [Xanthomonas euroxanthea]